jgi:hypothetical protein
MLPTQYPMNTMVDVTDRLVYPPMLLRAMEGKRGSVSNGGLERKELE